MFADYDMDPTSASFGLPKLAIALEDGNVGDFVRVELSANSGCARMKMGSDVKAGDQLVIGSNGLFTKKETNVKKKLKRFYIGKPDVVEGRDDCHWAHDTLPEAIEQAKARAELTGQPQYIVKVIKVVRRKEQPIVVEDVK